MDDSLHVIDGGGEGDGDPRGDLHPVDLPPDQWVDDDELWPEFHHLRLVADQGEEVLLPASDFDEPPPF